MKHRILFTDHLFENLDAERAILEPIAELVIYRERPSEAELRNEVRQADAILSQMAPLPARVIQAAERCQVIVRCGVGVDNVDVAAATAMGIPVCNVPDYGTAEVADHTLTLMLALIRKLPEQIAFLHSGGWGFQELRPIRRLSALTLGLYGFGRIARAVAQRASGFGFRIIAHDPFVPDEAFAAAGVTRIDPETLLAESDVLALHMPLLDATHQLMNADTLATMKRGALLINTARGGLVDTDALLAALDSGQLGGAALDVLETEPIPADHPLWQRERVILTPHLAWYSEESLAQLKLSYAEEARRVLEGQPPKHAVNPDYLHHLRERG